MFLNGIITGTTILKQNAQQVIIISNRNFSSFFILSIRRWIRFSSNARVSERRLQLFILKSDLRLMPRRDYSKRGNPFTDMGSLGRRCINEYLLWRGARHLGFLQGLDGSGWSIFSKFHAGRNETYGRDSRERKWGRLRKPKLLPKTVLCL